MNVLLLVVALATPVGAPRAGLPEAVVISAARPADCPVCETATVKAATSLRIGVWPAAKSAAPCALAELYVRSRFLSGPWSAARRLEAARRRGDADESRRMEAMLGELIGEALEVEGTEP